MSNIIPNTRTALQTALTQLVRIRTDLQSTIADDPSDAAAEFDDETIGHMIDVEDDIRRMLA